MAVPADRVERDNFGKDIVRDLSTTELECQQEMFPLWAVFDSPAEGHEGGEAGGCTELPFVRVKIGGAVPAPRVIAVAALPAIG